MNALVYNENLRNYDFKFSSDWLTHPFKGERFDDFINAFREYGFDRDLEVIKSDYASEEDLHLVHDDEEYIDRIKRGEGRDQDTPLDKSMYDPARLVVGTSKLAGELVWEGEYNKSIGIGGGLHHAKPSQEAGFCIFNDVAICAKNLIENYGAERILILDTDVHAGNGTSEIFYEDDRVLLVDLHQDPWTIYPGTGFVEQIGTGAGEGYTVNVPMPPEASDKAYGYVLDEVFKPLARDFRPEIIIRNGGSDPHFSDRLADMQLTLDGFRMIGSRVREVSSDVCEGKVVDLIASGYNSKVLPKAWLSLIAGLSDIDAHFEDSLPAERLERRRQGKMDETREVLREVKHELGDHWDF